MSKIGGLKNFYPISWCTYCCIAWGNLSGLKHLTMTSFMKGGHSLETLVSFGGNMSFWSYSQSNNSRQWSAFFSKNLISPSNIMSSFWHMHKLFQTAVGSQLWHGLNSFWGFSRPVKFLINNSYWTKLSLPDRSLIWAVSKNEKSGLSFSNNERHTFEYRLKVK